MQSFQQRSTTLATTPKIDFVYCRAQQIAAVSADIAGSCIEVFQASFLVNKYDRIGDRAENGFKADTVSLLLILDPFFTQGLATY